MADHRSRFLVPRMMKIVTLISLKIFYIFEIERDLFNLTFAILDNHNKKAKEVALLFVFDEIVFVKRVQHGNFRTSNRNFVSNIFIVFIS